MSNFILLKSFTKKILVLTTCILAGCSFIASCTAQAIVGKWKGGTAKIYYSAEYAKQMGKSMEEQTAAQLGNYTIEFKSDHTYTSTFTDPKEQEVRTMSGVWNLTGDNLQLKNDAKYNPRGTVQKSILAIYGNTMETTSLMPPGSQIIKMVSTNTRM
jgi:hypothetical protein